MSGMKSSLDLTTGLDLAHLCPRLSNSSAAIIEQKWFYDCNLKHYQLEENNCLLRSGMRVGNSIVYLKIDWIAPIKVQKQHQAWTLQSVAYFALYFRPELSESIKN